MAANRDPIILVEIDLWDGSQTKTLRLSNFGSVSRGLTSSSDLLLSLAGMGVALAVEEIVQLAAATGAS